MKSLKYKILFIILFMTIGIAAVTTNVIINGSTNITSNDDDFDVYFSDVSTASMVDSYQIISSKSLTFNVALQNINQYSMFEFMVTNASKNYDADVSLTCNTESDYISIDYSMYTATISARSTEMGYVSVNLSKTYTGSDELNVEINCNLSASAVERTTIVNDVVDSPVYYVGQEISIGSEKFNVMSSDVFTVTMFAQKNLGPDYRQTTSPNYLTFSDVTGWDYTPGPYDVDVLQYDGNGKTYLENYRNLLDNTLGTDDTAIRIITLKDLVSVGCVMPDNYDFDPLNSNCNNTSNSSWIYNDQSWWIASAWPGSDEVVWGFENSFSPQNYANSLGIRPVISVSREKLKRKIITFTIFGDEFTAYEGMTWEEWIGSTYNTIGCVVKDNYTFCSEYLSVSGMGFINLSEVIEEGDSYIAVKGGYSD